MSAKRTTASAKNLTVEEIATVSELLAQMGEPVTPQNLAKELGVKKTVMMKFLNDGKYHFDMTHWRRRDKNGRTVKEWITVDNVYPNAIDNPNNPEWLPMMKAKYAKYLYLTKVLDYGALYGWKLVVDQEGRYGYGWRNTEEKVKAVRDAGLLKDTVFCMGGLGDGWNETHLAFRTRDKDKAIKALQDAGWNVGIEKE